MSLRVLAAGTHSLLVDGGRPHHRGYGIPVGGPADRTSLALGNTLVGNPPLACALELSLTGPTLFADRNVSMCVYGAPFQIRRDGEPIEPGYTFTLRPGQTLHIGGTPSGCRAYLCVPGGFQAEPVLGSCTGFAPLQAGDRLECASSGLPGRGVDPATLPGTGMPADRSHILRCLPGPQADWFDGSVFTRDYRVTPASNRMGLRLAGPALALPGRELVSEPVAPGAVQITNDAQPIVLGVDGQTIGGYPKPAHVVTSDLDILGQLRPGDRVRFQLMSEAEAESLAVGERTCLQARLRRLRWALG